MSMETFMRIHQAMPYAHTVDFTGWGEPLLHKQIYKMIRMAADQECVTTMTSNGTALNQKNRSALLNSGLDRLVISVDGMRSETYDPIRIGSSFEQLSQRIASLASLIDSSDTFLLLGIAFTIQEDNACDLDLIIPWMNSVGTRVLHLKHLNVLSNSGDWDISFLRYSRPPQRLDPAPLHSLERKIHQLILQAKEAGIKVEMHSEFPMTSTLKGRHCLATPLDSVYFSYDGRMAPCCHFGHHVSRFFDGQLHPASSLFFGDIGRQSFQEVWNSPQFLSFREGFQTQLFPEECKTCYLLYGK